MNLELNIVNAMSRKLLPMKTVIAALSPSQAAIKTIIPDIIKMDTISAENHVNAIPNSLMLPRKYRPSRGKRHGDTG